MDKPDTTLEECKLKYLAVSDFVGRMRRDLELVAGPGGGGGPWKTLSGMALKAPNTGTLEKGCGGGGISDGVPMKGEAVLRDGWRGLTI